MAPRNATTPLSPLSPDSDQAPGLSRTPSFLEFAPKRAMASFENLAALANYRERLREARKIVWREQGRATRRAAGPVGVSRAWRKGRPRYVPQPFPASRILTPLRCQTPGAGGLAFAIRPGVNLILRMTRIDDVPSMQRSGPSRSDSQPCSVRLRLSPVAPRHLTTTLVPLTPGSFVVLYKFVLNALPPSPGRGAPTPPARARSSATPFSIPRPLPRTLPSLTTPRRPRPVPLDGRADAPGVAVQAHAAMMLRAGGRACESLRESRAADRDRAAGVEGETVLTVSPSLCPLSPIRAPRYRQRPIPSSLPRLTTGNRLKRSTFANGARPHALTNSSVARRLSARNASQRPCLLWQADDERRLMSTPGVTQPWVGCPARYVIPALLPAR
ncbi:hypothetical protein AcW1_005080 [Taiwanofungus camphoratus]|nr:hypothetical protein AcW1_005080 [Antrodia cinnamomea]